MSALADRNRNGTKVRHEPVPRAVKMRSAMLITHDRPPHAPPRISAALARFMLGALAAVAVLVVGGYFALRSVTTNEAERNTRNQVQVLGRLVESAGLSDGVLRGDPRALARLDDIVQAQVLS